MVRHRDHRAEPLRSFRQEHYGVTGSARYDGKCKSLMTNNYSDPVEATLVQADALEEQGKRLEALELLQRLQSSDDAVVLTRIGALQSDLERWHEAAVTLVKALDVDPAFWVAHFYLGLVYRAQGRLELAEAALGDAVKTTNPPPH